MALHVWQRSAVSLRSKGKGHGIDDLSTGGYPDEHAESDAHKLLLGAKKLLLEDIHIPEALLDGKRRHFAAFPILIANAGGAWTRPLVWDTGDLDSNSSAPELPAAIPPSVAAAIRCDAQDSLPNSRASMLSSRR
jgi:hypothetical protein